VSKKRNRPDESPSLDAFLDIVTNIVGILIILVMVVGVRARDVMVSAIHQAPASDDLVAAALPVDEITIGHADEAVQQVDGPVAIVPEQLATDTPAPSPSPAELPMEVVDMDTPRQEAAAVESDILKLNQQMRGLTQEAFVQAKRRAQLQYLVKKAEQVIEDKSAGLDDGQREKLKLNQQLASARDELKNLEQAREALVNQPPPVEVLRHLPTPLAKTVFGREEHLRLIAGRVAYVPLNQLASRLKSEAKQKLWKLKDATELTETIGPVDGFQMHYTLRRDQVAVESRVGPMIRNVVELDRFEVVPTVEPTGEPIEQALASGSRLRSKVDRWDPDVVTVTVWTYPDSFGDFRSLRDWLYERGFVTAGRPMPEGIPISGSPEGSHSAGQ